MYDSSFFDISIILYHTFIHKSRALRGVYKIYADFHRRAILLERKMIPETSTEALGDIRYLLRSAAIMRFIASIPTRTAPEVSSVMGIDIPSFSLS